MTKYDEPQDIWDGIVPCAVHQHLMTGCEHCAGEMTARSARLEQIQADANAVLKDIVTQGGPPLPPHVMQQAQIDVLLDSIMQDPKDRLRYEGEVGRRVMLMLKDMQKQVKQPVLHVARDMPRNVRNLKR